MLFNASSSLWESVNALSRVWKGYTERQQGKWFPCDPMDFSVNPIFQLTFPLCNTDLVLLLIIMYSLNNVSFLLMLNVLLEVTLQWSHFTERHTRFRLSWIWNRQEDRKTDGYPWRELERENFPRCLEGKGNRTQHACVFHFWIFFSLLLLPFYPSETTAFGETDLGISCVLIRGSKCAGRKD